MKTFSLFLVFAGVVCSAAPDGKTLYAQRCASCHDVKSTGRVPTHDELSAQTPEFIIKAMFEGAMVAQSAGLNLEEGQAISRFVTGKDFGTVGRPALVGQCTARPGPLRETPGSWNGWGEDLANTRFQAHPGLSADDVPKLKLKWAFAFPGDTVRSSQPTVVGDRLFVGSASGAVFALDAKTGCSYWVYDAGATVRNAITVHDNVVYFGDTRAYVHALDANTGKLLWKTHTEEHSAARVTGSPTFFNGRLYVPVSSIEEASAMLPAYECCKFRGSVVSLDAKTGKQIWKGYSVSDPAKALPAAEGAKHNWGPAGAAIWASPTIDAKNKVIYAVTGNSYTDVSISTSNAVLAFDMESGRLLWASQVLPKDNFTMGCGRGINCPTERGPDFDFGSSPVLRDLPNGKRILLCGQKSGLLWGLDPDDKGKVLWQTRLGKGGALGGIEWGIAADPQTAYVAVSDLSVRKPDRPGGMHAVDIATGAEKWSTPAPELTCTAGTKGCNSAQSAAISAMPGAVFSGSVDGHFRAYETATGKIIWDVNTVQEYQAVNGVTGKGGSLDTAGPVIANGIVYTNSGYGMWQGLPGNVLLAYSVDGK